MKIRFERSTSPATPTASRATKRPCPRRKVMFSLRSRLLATASRDLPETARMRSFTRRMSTRTGSFSTTPYSAARRAIAATLALATSVLVGMHPVLTQVPPGWPRSITATFQPSAAMRRASAGPDWPVPITMASKSPAITSSRSCLALRGNRSPSSRGDRARFDAEDDLAPRRGAPALQHEVGLARLPEREDCADARPQVPGVDERSDLRQGLARDLH